MYIQMKQLIIFFFPWPLGIQLHGKYCHVYLPLVENEENEKYKILEMVERNKN